jgi:polar amino acid transport system substrate-binding protein
MRRLAAALLLGLGFIGSAQAADLTLAPTGTLRAAYLQGNPAQAVQDPATGEVRGASADIARELARQADVPVAILPVQGVQGVIDAVRTGKADIGFIAYEPSRAGTVEFSQTYMLVGQTFIVPEASPIRSVADIDQTGRRIGAGRSDSIGLYLMRTLSRAAFVDCPDDGFVEGRRMLAAGEIDAFGANRQRLTTAARDMRGYRVLPDNLYGVPQTIIVPKGKPAALITVNRFIDEVRASGFLKAAIERSGVIGVEVAPPSDR